MARDYKPAPQKASSGRGSAFFTGLLVGLLLGVGASLALTMYLKGVDNPFIGTPQPNKEILAEKLPKEGISEENALPKQENPNPPKEAAKTDEEFDFYTILPDTESTVTEQEVKADPSPIKKDTYFLQVGAFADETDANDMKAKLALQGFEAVVQTANIADKGTWHRVRVGPLNDLDQINKVRRELADNGFKADLIKVHVETKPE